MMQLVTSHYTELPITWEVSDDNSDITPHYGCLMLWWTIYLESNHHHSKKLGKFNNTDHEITIFDGHFKWKQACLIVWYSYTVYKRTFYILNIPLLYERIYLYVWTQVSITSKDFAIHILTIYGYQLSYPQLITNSY